MKYVSVDLETTGLDPNKCQITMASFIVEDTSHPEVPVLALPHCTYMINHDVYNFEPTALKMTAHLFINSRWSSVNYDSWKRIVEDFLCLHVGTYNVQLAGKNIGGFDSKFLPKEILQRCSYRYIDAGSVLIDWSKDKVESLSKLKERLGLGSGVSHDAYDDAIDVIKILRTTYQ